MGPAAQLVNAHGASSDILSVDWCAHDQLLATGGHAGDLRIWDLRALTAADGTPKPLHVLMTQPSARGANQSGILVVEWSPTQRVRDHTPRASHALPRTTFCSLVFEYPAAC